jgi:hypothetical protein
MQRLSEKHPSEFLQVAFDYTDDLVTGETLTGGTGVINIAVEKGTDASPNNVLNGGYAIVTSFDGKPGAFVVQPVRAGVDGVDYHLSCLISTSLGNKYFRQAILPVRRR